MRYTNPYEFEQAYAERTYVIVEHLHAQGIYPEPCACGGEDCHGYRMTYAAPEEIREYELEKIRFDLLKIATSPLAFTPP